MKTFLSRLLSYLPLVLGLAILALAIPLVPWSKVLPYFHKLSPLTLVLLIICSLLYYLGRIMRYWLMMRMLDRPVKFRKVAIACMVAQPVAVLPGGEMYRGAMLKRYGNVSLDHGAPSVFAQSIAESIGLLVVALLGTAILHQYLMLLLVVAVILIAIWAFIRWHDAHASHRWVNKLPWVHVSLPKVRSFLHKNRVMLTGKNFFVLLAASLITTAAGTAILYISSQALDAHISLYEAAIAYAAPTVLELISFLPGGLGVNEGVSVSILTLFGSSLPVAVALTLIMRIFTLGIGFIYGFAAMAWARFSRYPRYDKPLKTEQA